MNIMWITLAALFVSFLLGRLYEAERQDDMRRQGTTYRKGGYSWWLDGHYPKSNPSRRASGRRT